jgi:transcriptional regulator with XRE-family HTH domain
MHNELLDHDMKRKTFGEILIDARLRSNLTQRDLATRLRKRDGTQISPQYLNDLEHDRRAPPTKELIEQLSTILGLTQDILFHYAGRLPPDLAGIPADQDTLKAAYAGFRRALKISK